MMRFQRVSPDYLPFSNSNGKISNSKTCKEKEKGKEEGFDCEGVKALRFRSPSKTQTHDSINANSNSPPLSLSLSENNNNQSQRQRLDGVGDALLQWGQKKRARLSRAEIRSLSLTVTHPSSSSSSSIHKLQRRGSPFLDKLAPPPPLPANATYATRTSPTLRTKETSGFIPNANRNLEDRSAAAANASPSTNTTPGNTPRAVSRSTVAKTSPPSPDKIASRKDEKPNGPLTRPDRNIHLDSAPLHLHQEPTNSVSIATAMAGGGGEKVNIEVIEWPKIYVALSRKEKEDDFLAMKGTKLPHRPKKRAKNIDRSLQYCFPGMWLSDLTKSRYEVKEKKRVKKQKRRGLKGMESVDSDSE